jgi:hypothetical protein
VNELLNVSKIAAQVPFYLKDQECRRIITETQNGLSGLIRYPYLPQESIADLSLAAAFLRRVTTDFFRFSFGVKAGETQDVLYDPAEVYNQLAKGRSYRQADTTLVEMTKEGLFEVASAIQPIVVSLATRSTVGLDTERMMNLGLDFMQLTFPYSNFAYQTTDLFVSRSVETRLPYVLITES